MDNIFIKYFRERHQIIEDIGLIHGPVMTISREFGCEANPMAGKLAERLNYYFLPIGAKKSWNIINKEILDLAASELQTDSKNIAYLFSFEQKNMVDDFIMSVSSKHHRSEWRIKEAIKDAIRAFGMNGYAIIVGRAGAQILNDVKNSLHVRLIAPFEWRVKRVMEKYHLSSADAEARVKFMDKNRKKLIAKFSKDADCHSCYDIFYNLKSLTHDQIIHNIIHMMQQKKLV